MVIRRLRNMYDILEKPETWKDQYSESDLSFSAYQWQVSNQDSSELTYRESSFKDVDQAPRKFPCLNVYS